MIQVKDSPEVIRIISLWEIIYNLKEDIFTKKPKTIIPHGSNTVIKEKIKELKIANPDLSDAEIILEAIQTVGKKKIKNMRLTKDDIDNLLEKAQKVYNKK